MSRVSSAALMGVDGVAIEVEVRVSSQLPRIDIVGLPEAAVRESAARVRAAIASAGHRFPDRRITINLAPAEVRKSGSGLDLAIAVGILAATSAFEPAALERCAFVGELALDGRLRPVRGALALAIAAHDAGCTQLVVPATCAPEAALAQGIEVRAATDLSAVLAHLLDAEPLPRAVAPAPSETSEPLSSPRCLSSVRGQATAKRALLVAASGGHGLLLSGPPGSGKTLLARCLPSLLPPLNATERIETTRIHGASGLLADSRIFGTERPFRAPHHTASPAGLLGGGNPPRPGEVSLAHCGVLFLDELPEFDRRGLEALREVMEDRRVRIARAHYRCDLPAAFQLIAACNPCPCGWYRSGQRDCRCDDGAIARYRQKLSGPLLDRIDLHVELRPVPWSDLNTPTPHEPGSGERSTALRRRVLAARALQAARGDTSNAAISDENLDMRVAASTGARALLGRAVEGLGLSARAAHRALRVARTCADLAGEERVGVNEMAEAISYRAPSMSEEQGRRE